MSEILEIPLELFEEIQREGERAYPEEGVGFVIGINGDVRQVTSLYPVKNASPKETRHNRYDVAPKDIMEADGKAEKMGQELLGAYHSHPDHPDKPSEIDRKRAHPRFSYIITSVKGGKAISTRSWQLKEDRSHFTEEKISIVSQ